jgi:hypothetical protein
MMHLMFVFLIIFKQSTLEPALTTAVAMFYDGGWQMEYHDRGAMFCFCPYLAWLFGKWTLSSQPLLASVWLSCIALHKRSWNTVVVLSDKSLWCMNTNQLA